MKLPFEINTVEKTRELSTIINKSNFIAQIFQVDVEDKVKEFLSGAKKKNYEASHHCYAFKLADGTCRYSDAGEPNGTAGIRILNAIDHFNLSNQLIIVSRIFGGVKLGVGPLGKAYYEAAVNVIQKSKISIRQLFRKAIIITNYQQVSSIQKLLTSHKSIIINSEFEEKIELICLLNSNEMDVLIKKISETDTIHVNLILQDEMLYR